MILIHETRSAYREDYRVNVPDNSTMPISNVMIPGISIGENEQIGITCTKLTPWLLKIKH